MSETQQTQSQVQLDHYTPGNVVVEPDAIAAELREKCFPTLGYDDSEWAKVVPDTRAGWCYQLSEAYYHAVDPDTRERLTPMQVTVDVRHPVFVGEVSHWFLVHDDGAVIDLTAEQFHVMSIEIPYGDARGRGFVPPSPSEQSEQLLAVITETDQ